MFRKNQHETLSLQAEKFAFHDLNSSQAKEQPYCGTNVLEHNNFSSLQLRHVFRILVVPVCESCSWYKFDMTAKVPQLWLIRKTNISFKLQTYSLRWLSICTSHWLSHGKNTPKDARFSVQKTKFYSQIQSHFIIFLVPETGDELENAGKIRLNENIIKWHKYILQISVKLIPIVLEECANYKIAAPLCCNPQKVQYFCIPTFIKRASRFKLQGEKFWLLLALS